MVEVKKVRRELSARLIKAHREGRLHDELRALEREGDRAFREAVGRPKAKRRRAK